MNKPPKYMDAIMAALKENPLRAGSINMIEVRHDLKCPQLNGKGACDCEPEVNFVRDTQ